MKVNKAPGLDGLPLELWNLPTFKEMLLSTCNDILNGNHLSAWGLSSGIVPVHKKSYLTKADNYRGISLTQVAAKFYNCLLLNRLRSEIDKNSLPKPEWFSELAIDLILNSCVGKNHRRDQKPQNGSGHYFH